MKKYFGTDGVRGLANELLTPELAFELGRAAASVLIGGGLKKILIGKDTRISGDMLEAALAAGICSAGVQACLLGVIPTPGVSALAAKMGIPGAMVSASHNHYADNGIKFFNREGRKISLAEEAKIESLLSDASGIPRPTGENVGVISHLENAAMIYTELLKSKMEVDLSGLKIVLDSANGAASNIAEQILRDYGGQVISIFNRPDGSNINQNCGSTMPSALVEVVKAEKADIGLALDGDADRILAVDENGDILDGDAFLGLCGAHLHQEGKLKNSTVVVTFMSNLGLSLHLNKQGIKVVETPVGDRFVAEKMQELEANFGGEQSGHIIMGDYGNTGDGLVSALYLLKVMTDNKLPLSELAARIPLLPQAQINVKVTHKEGWEEDPEIQAAYAKAQAHLSGKGRAIIRPSGTEELIRVMTEGNDPLEIAALAQGLAETIHKKRGK